MFRGAAQGGRRGGGGGGGFWPPGPDVSRGRAGLAGGEGSSPPGPDVSRRRAGRAAGGRFWPPGPDVSRGAGGGRVLDLRVGGPGNPGPGGRFSLRRLWIFRSVDLDGALGQAEPEPVDHGAGAGHVAVGRAERDEQRGEVLRAGVGLTGGGRLVLEVQQRVQVAAGAGLLAPVVESSA